ncbi:MAG TPA: 4-amino-4-deoxy-L-arabinose transferase [Holosporales bacterium]|nr:4-amino-4-deoxy-L-arabinose transferase [Holosporales bacterium]
MSASITYLPLILFAVLLNTAAQIVLKMGMKSIGHFEFSSHNIVPILLKMAQNPHILGGVSLYVFSLGAWLLTLSRVEVSLAYPLTSLGYVFTALVGYYVLQENMGIMRIAGILVIMIGVYLVTRST